MFINKQKWEEVIDRVTKRVSYSMLSSPLYCSLNFFVTYIYNKVYDKKQILPEHIRTGIELHENIDLYLKEGMFHSDIYLDERKLEMLTNTVDVIKEIMSSGFDGETEMSISRMHNEREFIGRVDLLLRNGGKVLVIDYKYSSNRDPSRYIPQLSFYSFILEGKYNIIRSGILFISRSPEFYVVNLNNPMEKVMKLVNKFFESVREVKPNMNYCNGCPNRYICHNELLNTSMSREIDKAVDLYLNFDKNNNNGGNTHE